MKFVAQRVSRARLTVGNEPVSEIGCGLVVYFGVKTGDGAAQAEKCAEKIAHLRVFEDEAGKMNRSLLDIGGEALIVSQFTLYGDASHGRRPSFTEAARPELANPLYETFVELCRGYGVRVATGRFGADMKLSLVNDGPVTIMVESR